MKNAGKWLKAARLLLGLVLLWLILRQIDGADLLAHLRDTGTRWPWLIYGILFSFAGLGVGVLRWHRLLRSLGSKLTIQNVFEILFIGQFFNAFMPGACGGDVVRGYYAAKDSERGSRTEAATTVIADRLIGLFTLIAWCTAVVLLRLDFFFRQPETRITGILTVLLLAGSLLGILIFFGQHRFEHWKLFRHAEEKLHAGPLLRRAYDALYEYKRQPMTLCIAIVYSLMNMAFLTLACWSFGCALALPLPLLDYFTLFPILTILASVPLTPGALGIRENLFATLFGTVGIAASNAVTLSLFVYLGGVVCSLFGGALFIRHSSRSGHSLKQEWEEMKRGNTLE